MQRTACSRDRLWEPPTGLARGKRPHWFTLQQLWDPDYKFLPRQYEYELEIFIYPSNSNLLMHCCLNISINRNTLHPEQSNWDSKILEYKVYDAQKAQGKRLPFGISKQFCS